MAIAQAAPERRIFAVLVDNEPGVLARVIGLFSGRGYNIESLTVTEVDPAAGLSRITVISRGTPQVLNQIYAQLDRLVPVHRVSDLTSEYAGAYVDRETALIKVAGNGEKRVEALRLADIFKAEVVDAGHDHFVFQATHRPDKLERFIDLMRPLGLIDVCRTGVIAISRGARGM
ncbi:MAG: acetolactate synthase small subunit [Rhodospirillales bacterium]|nr:acetolactate synthase small subunit [Rhodospirillales bacterium]